MAVTSFKRIHEGRQSATEADSSGKVVIRYTDVYRAITDDPYTEPENVKAYAGCPKVGQVHPRDGRCWCRSVSPRNEPFSKQIYLVTVGYSSEFEMEIDPTAEPARIAWHTASFQVPVVFDLNGIAHLNAARDPFDPPALKDDPRWMVTVRKNVAAVPTWILDYRSVTNDADFNLQGVTIPKGWARIAEIEIGEEQERNDVKFYPLTLGMEIVTPALDASGNLVGHANMFKFDSVSDGYVALGPTETEHAHAIISLNAGLYCYGAAGAGALGTIMCVDKDGKEAVAPMLLQANGTQLATPASLKDAKYIVSDVYQPKDFSVLPLS